MPSPGSKYYPLDVEQRSSGSHHALASLDTGWRTVEELEQESRFQEANLKRRNTITYTVVGSIFIVLIVLAAVTTHPTINSSRSNRNSSQTSSATAAAADETDNSSTPSHGVWNEGGLDFEQLAKPGADFVPCKGSALRCEMINKIPTDAVDFRNISRRATAVHGMVAADNSRCSEIGRDVLAAAGNAADAAVAVALCLGVVNPVSSGLGGGAFITVRLADGTAAFIDARETAPAAATEDMYQGLPGNTSLFGGLAVAVPGELHGLAQLHEKYGSLPWSELVRPAVQLARDGFAAHPYLVYSMNGPSNSKRIASTPALRRIFMIKTAHGGWRLPHIGELCCKRPALATTLENIAAQGAGYLSRPDVAAAMASELAAAGGIITADDFINYKPADRELLKVELGDLELLVPPPPSSAAVVAFALKFLAGYGNTLQSSSNSSSSSSSGDNDSHSTSANFGGVDGDRIRDGGLGLHRLVEAMKHGYAIRTALGDPGLPEQPYEHAAEITAAVEDLINDDFIDKLRHQTLDDGVLPDEEYGGRWNPLGVVPADESGTSHFCVVDRQRNAVSVTTSVNGPFGSGVVSESTGTLFGNTMDDFAQPNKSSIVTPHPSQANFIAPGKRPLSAMSPIIVSHKPSGRLVALAGASGGPLIVSATLQTLARLLLEGVDVSDAVTAPRLHDQLLPKDDTFYENYTWGHTSHQLPPKVVQRLQQRGQVATPAGSFSLGVSQAIHVLYGDFEDDSTSSERSTGSATEDTASSRKFGLLVGQSDSRKDGAPLGW